LNDVFECRKCGNCCRPRGYVRLEHEEVDRIATHIGMPVHEFTRCYARITEDRAGLSLVERADGACVFLSAAGECAIQGVKPKQCRDFPVIWSYPGFEKHCRAMEREPK